MPATEQRYVPANGRFLPTSIYDRSIAITMREGAWRPRLVREVLEGEPAEVLDLGCGSGTLAIAIARRAGRASGDGDRRGSRDPRHRACQAGGRATSSASRGWRTSLPFEDASFDRVVTSLLLHHLDPPVKRAALGEAHRVLRPGGRLHVADFGRSQDPLMRLLFAGLQVLDGFSNTADHPAGRLPGMIADAGFADVESGGSLRTTWGTFELLTAAR